MKKSWSSPVTIQDRDRAIEWGDYVYLAEFDRRIAFDWGLANMNGAYFVLIKEEGVTHKMLNLAGRILRGQRDVVSLAYAEIECCPKCGVSDELHPFQLSRFPESNHWVRCVVCEHEWSSDNYRKEIVDESRRIR